VAWHERAPELSRLAVNPVLTVVGANAHDVGMGFYKAVQNRIDGQTYHVSTMLNPILGWWEIAVFPHPGPMYGVQPVRGEAILDIGFAERVPPATNRDRELVELARLGPKRVHKATVTRVQEESPGRWAMTAQELSADKQVTLAFIDARAQHSASLAPAQRVARQKSQTGLRARRFFEKVPSTVDGKVYSVSTVKKHGLAESRVFEGSNHFRIALGLGKRRAAHYQYVPFEDGPRDRDIWDTMAWIGHKETVELVRAGEAWQMSKESVRSARKEAIEDRNRRDAAG